MTERKPRPTGEWLAASSLRNLLQRVEIHKRLLADIRTILPAPLAEHCRDCAVDDGHLIVYTDGQNWAFQLRFLAGDLLARLKAARGVSFRSLRARGLPIERQEPRPRALSDEAKPETAALVERYSQDSTSEELRLALSRLAATLRNPPTQTGA
ncbi:DUF721 domain-containing protein [Methylococcus sp. EFPC2]|uniref:DUF721 domain-containing protein n=1 Tax=Methylococcus sp. EFPC2 TaxID=2812648 RepID=UPI001967EDB4|nr:DUF721 domain-containing protein [Methylococcus sp. EFPC2]QSA95918.1 DUF721 domain-containing protein [Methylococcus sp. EFPC2]